MRATYELFAKKCRELAARMIKADDKKVLELKARRPGTSSRET